MSIHRVRGFDGRDRGWQGNAFVYMLLCRDDGPVYVKVGRTRSPTKRLGQLRQGCPVTPHQFHFVEVRTWRIAGRLERALLAAFEKYRQHGEWAVVPLENRAEFNAAWKPVLVSFGDSQYPPQWQQISVAAVVKEAHRRRRAVRGIKLRYGRP